MVDGVKARLDICVQHPAITLGAEQVNLGDRVVCAPLGPEPIGDRHEVGLEDRFQHQFQRRLDNPVGHRRNPDRCDEHLDSIHPGQVLLEDRWNWEMPSPALPNSQEEL